MKRKEYLGGEKLFPLSLLFKKKTENIFFREDGSFEGYKTYYTFGAHSSLLAIIDNLQIKSGQFVLLPSYLCESILISFKQRSVKYQFYSIDIDLKPDFDDIDKKLSAETCAILFIDYMGYSHYDALKKHQLKYLQRNISIIQDAVQSVVLDNKLLYGDYVINSFRKTTGVEGGILLSKKPMSITYAKGSNFQFLFFKRSGQFFRFLHLNFPSVFPTWFLFCFRKAELFYYKSKIYKLPSLNRFFLSRIDFCALHEGHLILNSLLRKKWARFQPSHLNQNHLGPLGFFMLTQKRDIVVKALAKEAIYCPIHWKLPEEVSKEIFTSSWQLSEHAFTVPFTFPLTISINLMDERVNRILKASSKIQL